MTRVLADDILPDHCSKDVVVLCCGNMLFGDDGFGPAVAEKLSAACDIPEWAVVIDAGTAVRGLLFDMILSERRPRLVVVVDAVDLDREPGTVFEILLDEIPRSRASEFSLHQAPTSNLLRELQKIADVRVAIIVCQVKSIPEEMTGKISPEVAAAVGRAASLVETRFLHKPVAAKANST
jgi:coenzyme F420 hydrogenase subunit delta